MELSSKIDYITLTTNRMRYQGDILPQATDLSMAADLTRWLLRDIGVQRPVLETSAAPKGYHWGFRTFGTGVEIGIAQDITRQGAMMRLSGSVLDEISDVRMWLLHAIDKGWRASRIDIAFDVYDSGISADTLASKYLAIQDNDRKLKTSYVQSPRGSTFYIGARTSRAMLRVYDKGRQQGTFLDWLRLELEVKGDLAHQYAADAIRDPYSFVPNVVKMLNGAVPSISDALLEGVAGSAVLETIIPRTRTNRGLWFHTTVIKSFAGLLLDDRASAVEFLNRCSEIVANGLDEPPQF